MTQNDEAGSESKPSKVALWTGRVLSALPVLMLVMSAVMKLSGSDAVVKGFAEFGYPKQLIPVLGVVELLCTLLYVIPQTSFLGAILLTGYFGGAVATHARVQQWAFIGPVIFGVLLWTGLFLRYPRLRTLVPLQG